MTEESFLNKRLQKRLDQGTLRVLPNHKPGFVDLESNDFLGLAQDKSLQQTVLNALQGWSEQHPSLFGSTGSRLVSGNYPLLDEIETELAAFFSSESTLIFKSGFEANQSLFGYIPERNDTVLYDAHIHASIRTALKHSGAQSFSFRHNDLNDLMHKAKSAKGKIFVATESVFSIFGDEAPLQQLALLCEQNHWHLIVDEAHSTGIYGPKGEGLCCYYGIEDQVFARIMTFGKAAGCAGSVVAGSTTLRSALINFAVPFIYSTAMPPSQAISIREHIRFISMAADARNTLTENKKYFNTLLQTINNQHHNTPKHIVPVFISDISRCIEAATKLREKGFAIKAMLPPTTPEKLSLLRISLHSFNKKEEFDIFFHELRKLL